ncbi:MAG: sugar transferase [Deltaproteobacteria bacterium]|nr:sugar transferase [Deltaproteobacteria bacterium]
MSSESLLRGRAARIVKRLFDVGASTAVLGFGWPVMVGVATAIRATSSGPVFFIQERAGRGGRPFRMYKFRTMTHRPDKAQTLDWSSEEAAAVTPIGSFLRDYGLDELPQVLNILKGEMSVIGPRPTLPRQAEEFCEREKRMLDMRPGVLSLAAIRGRRGISMSERYELHAQYVDTWSLLLDLEILIKSAVVVLGRQNAVEKTV